MAWTDGKKESIESLLEGIENNSISSEKKCGVDKEGEDLRSAVKSDFRCWGLYKAKKKKTEEKGGGKGAPHGYLIKGRRKERRRAQSHTITSKFP